MAGKRPREDGDEGEIMARKKSRQDGDEGEVTEPDHIRNVRIGPQTKIQPCVRFALEKLQENEKNIVTFHTFPVPGSTKVKDVEEPPEPLANPKLHNTTMNVPRLLTIVEVVKREFLEALGVKDPNRITGLHQYNEFGCLEDLEPPVDTACSGNRESARAKEIADALKGKNFVLQRQTPYLKVTLSQSEILELVQKGATHQPPKVRKLSKSAKKRHKKRVKKATEIQAPSSGEGDAGSKA